jgi:hypothetical protein
MVLLRYLSNTLLLAGLALLAAAGALYLVGGEPARVSIDGFERAVDGVVPGTQQEVIFDLRNPTWHNARIVGLAEC